MKVFAGAMFWKERKEERKKGFVCSMSRGPSLAIPIVCWVCVVFYSSRRGTCVYPVGRFLAGHAFRFLLFNINILSPLAGLFSARRTPFSARISALSIFDLAPTIKPLRLYIAFALHGGHIRGVLYLVGGGRVVVFFCIRYWVLDTIY